MFRSVVPTLYILMFGFNIVVVSFPQSFSSETFCKEVRMRRGGGLISEMDFLLPD